MTKVSSRSWSSLDPTLHVSVSAALSNTFGFETMTPVQAATIPVFRTGTRDVAVQACTGSGKTLAFLIPIFEVLLRRQWHSNEVGAVILVPTRELAQQIFTVADALLQHIEGLGALLLIGGSCEDQRTAYNAANVIIGTPGRLEETLRSPKLQYDVRALEILVLDEADRLLDMAFEVSLRNILARLPRQRRTALFSATQTNEVEALVRAGLRNPTRIDVQVQRHATPATLTNGYVTVEPEVKLAQLVTLLQTSPHSKIIVFVLTCAGADYFGAVLPLMMGGACRRIRALHGKMKQVARNRTLADFVADSEPTALVCTDVMARGIDVPDVDLIVQYDPPQDPSFFVHRVGRTARAGRVGRALIFLLPSESEYVDLLESRAVPVQAESCPEVDADGCIAQMRDLALQDRNLMEKGQRAFVSFVRGYKEHQCNYIFQLKRLSLPLLARGFGLLFFPRMPELKAVKDRDAFAGVDVDPDSIPYKDKTREKQRLASLGETQAARKAAKAKRDRQRKEAEQRQKVAVKARRKRKQSETQDRHAEWDDLDNEIKAFKKLKKGKISMKEFEIAVGERANDHSDQER